jgi:hypothetical protein
VLLATAATIIVSLSTAFSAAPLPAHAVLPVRHVVRNPKRRTTSVPDSPLTQHPHVARLADGSGD